MQKIINAIALGSGLVSLAVVGATGYVYLNRESIQETAKERVTKAVTEAVSGALGGLGGIGGGAVGGSVPGMSPAAPELPSAPSLP
jgi:hypothetical protein|tara:strand:+ start:2427 stop:2684 length:258 start_codon:yes stop_codon:yes gene_type:complete